MEWKNPKYVAALAIVLLAALAYNHYLVPRHTTSPLLLSYALAFASFFALYKLELGWQWVLGIGIACRFMLFGGLPSLSDDFYRFIWDGQLLAKGISPFAQLPTWYFGQENTAVSMPLELYQKLNSPQFFTIYPPVSQFIFWISVTIGQSTFGAVCCMRVIILIFEVLNFFLLRQLLKSNSMDASLISAYFLNPLVILELTGNLHFEGLVLTSLLATIYFYQSQHYFKTGLAIGFGVAVKIVPLVLLPIFLFREKLKHQVAIYTASALAMFAFFVPIFDIHLLNGLQNSLALFINKFEFNASIYYLAREVGYWKRGFNIIQSLGPALAYITLFLVFIVAFLRRKSINIATTFTEVLIVYLCLALVVHPWYIIPVIGLSVLTGYRFPTVWSALIFLTYSGYTLDGYQQPYLLIGLEYLVLYSWMIWEIWMSTNRKELNLSTKIE